MKKITLHCWALCLLSAPAWANTPLPDFAPPAEGQQVVINIPQLKLFLYQNGTLLKSYNVAVGKNTTRTPLGEYKIGAKAYNPTWHIPSSIQREMAAKGQPVQTTIPPGPKNPLGPVFVRLGDPKLGLGIHGTNAPGSVPGVRSHGCVRMQSPNALEFAKSVRSGADAAVVYQLASLNVDEAGHLWLAAYRDPYNKKNLDRSALNNSMTNWAAQNQLKINTQRVNHTLTQRNGRLVCVTCTAAHNKVQGKLSALAWQSGSGDLVSPKAVFGTPPSVPEQDQILPEGSAVEALTDPVPSSHNPAPHTQKPLTPAPASTPPVRELKPINTTPVAVPPASDTPEETMLKQLL